MTTLQNIANKIKTARSDKGISQAKLAEISGVPISTIKRIESGKFNVSVSVLDRVLQPLGLCITVNKPQ